MRPFVLIVAGVITASAVVYVAHVAQIEPFKVRSDMDSPFRNLSWVVLLALVLILFAIYRQGGLKFLTIAVLILSATLIYFLVVECLFKVSVTRSTG